MRRFSEHRVIGPLIFLLLLSLIASTDLARHFSPDSWTLYELAQSILSGDFYHLNTVRGYAFTGNYSAAFPPLWPAFIATAEWLTAPSAGAQLLISALTAGFTAWLLAAFANRTYGSKWLGLALFLLLILNRHYAYSLRGGHTLMPYLALLTLVYYAWIKLDFARWQTALLFGILCGLMALTRFEGLVYALAFGGLICWKMRWRGALVFYAALPFAISPWIFYSQVHFGLWYASDNARNLPSVAPRFVLEYLPQGFATWRDDFPGWLLRIARDSIAWMGVILRNLSYLSLLALLGWRMGLKFRRNSALAPLFLPLIPAYLLIGASGYHEARYLLPLELTLAIYLLSLVDWRNLPRRLPLLLTALSLCTGLFYLGEAVSAQRALFGALRAPEKLPTDIEALNDCLENGKPGPILLPGDRLSYQFGARGIRPVYLAPSNLKPADYPAFLKSFSIGYILEDGANIALPQSLQTPPICTLAQWGKIRHPLHLRAVFTENH